jgi:flagellar FliL protein
VSESDPNADEKPGGKRKSSFALLASVALFAVVGGGAASWLLQQRGQQNVAVRADGSANGAPKYLIPLEGFTVNLADPEETHFLRVTISLGIDKVPEGVEKDKPSAAIPVARVRDAILAVLTSCKADELLTPDGKIQLKKNVLAAVQKNVPELGVREVYFTEFLVQR